MSETESENHKDLPLKEKAEKVQSARNEKWRSAWDDWQAVSFIDHAIAKIKRAHNVLGNDEEVVECLVDAHNYLEKLKRNVLEEEQDGV